jgi:cob(I)alamin adenosyltransferase
MAQHARTMTLQEVLYQCLRHFSSMDEANAAIGVAVSHCSPAWLRRSMTWAAPELHGLGARRAYEEDEGGDHTFGD